MSLTLPPISYFRNFGRTSHTLFKRPLSGLFVINTLLTQPDAFNAYVAISPCLWWNKQAVCLSAEAMLIKPVQKNTFLYFALCPDDSPCIAAKY